jgi:pyruvate/2-oxoglutarate dehydrogenase complex dihydrolipoamide acyltransferase (E2) component
MTFPIRAPRVNNNDDFVRLSAVFLEAGAEVQVGQIVAEVETDKATFSVETERSGFFLKCLHAVGETIAVGSVLLWMGETAADRAPEETVGGPAAGTSAEPTLKALMLLKQYGIEAGQVPSSSERLTAAEVEAYIQARGLQPYRSEASPAAAGKRGIVRADVAADVEDLSLMERGMLRAVCWHRDEAVAGYVEIAYDPAAWERYSAAFQKEHKLLLNPLLALLAYRLVALRAKNPRYNATVQGERKVLYRPVNVGFTVQSGDNLYLTVAAGADKMTAREFVSRLNALQKAAMKNRLQPAETSGATIAFSSMARWGVVRHQPILAPFTSLMVAHSAAVEGRAALGATYDHRILSGGDAVAALQFLKDPPEV